MSLSHPLSLYKLKHSFFTLSFPTGEDLRVFSSSYLVATLSFVCVFWSLNVYQCITACRPCLLRDLGAARSLIICRDPLLLFCGGLLQPLACGSSAVASECACVCAGLGRAGGLSLHSPLSRNTPRTWMFTWLNSLSTFTRAHTKYRTPYSVFKYPIRTCLSAFPFTVLSCYFGHGLWIQQPLLTNSP